MKFSRHQGIRFSDRRAHISRRLCTKANRSFPFLVTAGQSTKYTLKHSCRIHPEHDPHLLHIQTSGPLNKHEHERRKEIAGKQARHTNLKYVPPNSLDSSLCFWCPEYTERSTDFLLSHASHILYDFSSLVGWTGAPSAWSAIDLHDIEKSDW